MCFSECPNFNKFHWTEAIQYEFQPKTLWVTKGCARKVKNECTYFYVIVYLASYFVATIYKYIKIKINFCPLGLVKFHKRSRIYIDATFICAHTKTQKKTERKHKKKQYIPEYID